MITCTKCNKNKQESEFYEKKTENRRHSYCKSCFNSYCMERWTKTKLKAIEYKGGKCQDCDKKFDHYLYDFHHLDPKEKDVEWTKLRLRSWKKITAELDKCVLLCCMCHRIREYSI
jgi:hypothetical protein